jgi:aldose sugar dehydrogenase
MLRRCGRLGRRAGLNHRRMLTGLIVAVSIGSIFAACAPAKEPPPPPPPPAAGLEPPDSSLPPGSPALNVDANFVTGLSNPWDMAFLSGGTMFFTQRASGVYVRFPDGTITDAVSPSDMLVGGAMGAMGLAVDSGSLFLCYTTSSDVRVVRFPYTLGSNTVTVGAGVPVVPGIPKANDHFGCRVRLGPDEKIWVTTGDGAIATAPQDINSLAGKVLRVNPDGSAPSDNPFVSKLGDDRIYTYGHRNPQGIAFSGGQPYSVEHGSAIDDEVNKLFRGGNGGWDPVDEFGNYDGFDTFPPMTDFGKFPDAMNPVWKSGEPTVAPSGGTFLTGSEWGSWNGALVVAFLKDSKARVMLLDGAGGIVSSSPFLEHGIRLRSAVESPDGDLYIATDVGGGGGAIWKITPS